MLARSEETKAVYRQKKKKQQNKRKKDGSQFEFQLVVYLATNICNLLNSHKLCTYIVSIWFASIIPNISSSRCKLSTIAITSY